MVIWPTKCKRAWARSPLSSRASPIICATYSSRALTQVGEHLPDGRRFTADPEPVHDGRLQLTETPHISDLLAARHGNQRRGAATTAERGCRPAFYYFG